MPYMRSYSYLITAIGILGTLIITISIGVISYWCSSIVTIFNIFYVQSDVFLFRERYPDTYIIALILRRFRFIF